VTSPQDHLPDRIGLLHVHVNEHLL
jgi:hypothetical protein